MAKVAICEDKKTRVTKVQKIGFRTIDVKKMYSTADGITVIKFYQSNKEKRSR